MTYNPGTVGWLKYDRSATWYKVDVLWREEGTHTYRVRRSRTEFVVGPRDLLVVVG